MEWLATVEALPGVEWLRLSSWAYPLVNTLHIIGIALLFGAIFPFDLKLAGWRRDGADLAASARLLLPVAVAGLVLAATAGLLLFATDAQSYAASPVFQLKLLLLVAAIGNALLLRRVDWSAPRQGRVRLALAGLLSIALWTGVIVLGGWIAYA